MLAACLAALALTAPAPLDDRGYLAVADRIQPAFDPQWDESAGHYVVAGGGVEATTNANLLLVHAVAALRRAAVVARALRTRPQSSAPRPGPTLALRVRGSRFAVRLSPAPR
jgi:hypothetical protein